MNYMLQHEPVLTFDVDLWIEDTRENRQRCHLALQELSAEWGETEHQWAAVSNLPEDWLARQTIYCLTSPAGAIDIFRHVQGLPDWQACSRRARHAHTASGVAYRGLSDEDMLASQLALDQKYRKTERVEKLRALIRRASQ
jgi:hypothetical protein